MRRERAWHLCFLVVFLIWGAGLATAALYPQDHRRDLTGADLDRYKGAGVLWCRRSDGVPQKAAAAWLVADPSVVVAGATQPASAVAGIVLSFSIIPAAIIAASLVPLGRYRLRKGDVDGVL